MCLSNRKKAPAALRTAAIPFPSANFPGIGLILLEEYDDEDDKGVASEKEGGPVLEAEIELEDRLQECLPSAPPFGTFQDDDEFEVPELTLTLNINARKSCHPPCIVAAGVLHQRQCDETSLIKEQSNPPVQSAHMYEKSESGKETIP